jgi:hypothetical protein
MERVEGEREREREKEGERGRGERGKRRHPRSGLIIKIVKGLENAALIHRAHPQSSIMSDSDVVMGEKDTSSPAEGVGERIVCLFVCLRVMHDVLCMRKLCREGGPRASPLCI